MLKQLAKIEQHYNELEAQIATPEVATNPKKLEKLARERASLEDLVSLYRRYRKTAKSLEEAREMLAEEKDEEMAALVRQEIESLQPKLEQQIEELKAANEGLKNGIKQGQITELANGFVSANVVEDAFSRQAIKAEYSKRIDIREGQIKVLDSGGNLTALSVEDLNKEFMTASIYASHIKSSDANGGGANGSRNKADASGAGVKANLNGNVTEKATALAGAIDGFADLPIN